MKYYPHHIGDFNRATRHLTRIERSIYRDMIELYYEEEKQLPLEFSQICRKVIARSTEEVTAVEQVLNEFFVKTPNGWYHDRCEEEIELYKKHNTQKSNAGKASAAAKSLKRQQAINGISTPVEHPLNGSATDEERHLYGISTNQEPGTRNQEPINKKNNAGETFEKPEQSEPGYVKTDIQEPYTDSRAMFEMSLEWKPTAAINGVMKFAGLPYELDTIPNDRLIEFVTHWFGKPERRTQDGWHSALTGWLKMRQHDKPKPAAPEQPPPKEYKDPAHKYFVPLTEEQKRKTPPEALAKLKGVLAEMEAKKNDT